jgi:alpha-galactosidase
MDDETLILAKPLEDGSLAVGLFNLWELPREITVTWDQLGLEGEQRVRDVWRQRDVGEADGRYSAEVARHGVMFVRMWPKGK